MGAWIETGEFTVSSNCSKSRPAWARGLKLQHLHRQKQQERSRPAWARGLKLFAESYKGFVLNELIVMESPLAQGRGLKLHPSNFSL